MCFNHANEVPIIHPLESTNYLIEGIRQIALGKYKYALIFFQILNPKIYRDLLISLIQSQSPPIYVKNKKVPSPANFRWAIHCIASFLNIENEIDTFLLIQPRFISYVSRKAQQLRYFLRDPEIMNNTNTKMNCAEAFLDFINEDRYLSLWLRPHMLSVFESINVSDLYQTFKYRMFYLFDDCSQININEISKLDFEYNDHKSYETLYQIPQIYTNTNILNVIELSLFKKYRFPTPTLFAGSNLYVSLINTTYSTHIHFIDLLQKHVSELFSKYDYENFNLLTGYFGSLQPWFLVLTFHDKYPLLPSSYEKPDFKFESICTNFIQRLYNDRILLQSIRQLTGTNKSSIEFINHSLPYILFSSINISLSHYYQPLEDLSPLQFFCISDDDRNIDYDFNYSYFVLDILMGFINSIYNNENPNYLNQLTASSNPDTTNHSSSNYDSVESSNEFILNSNSDFYDEVMTQCEWFISSMSNQDKVESLKEDIFSLIFIQKDGKYVCSFDIASSIIKMLLSLDDNSKFMQYVRTGYNKFNLTHCLKVPLILENVVLSTKNRLLDSLISGDRAIAKYLSSLSKEYMDLYTLFDVVKEYSQNKIVDSCKMNELAILEIALSFEDTKDILQKAVQLVNDDSKSIYQNRYCGNDNFIQFPNYSEYVEQFSNLKRNEWPIISVQEDILPSFSSFSQKLNSFIPISLQSKLGESVEDVLWMNPSYTIISLLKSSKIKEAEELADKLNTDIKEIVFSNNYYPKDVFNHYLDDYPQVVYTQYLTNKFEFDEYPNHFPFVLKNLFINRSNTSERERKIIELQKEFVLGNKHSQKNQFLLHFPSSEDEIDFYDSIYQDGYNKIDKLVIILEKSLSLSSKPLELIYDIRYRIPEDLFKSVFIQNLSNDNISEFRNILLECFIDTTELDFLLSIKIPPIPYYNSFKSLIETSQFVLAAQFYSLFYQNDYSHSMIGNSASHLFFNEIIFTIVKEEISRSKKSEIIEKILNYFPTLKSDVLDLLPPEQKRLYDSDFHDFLLEIPNEWEVCCSPNDIIANHINEFEIVYYLLGKFSFIDCDDILMNLIDDSICNKKYITDYDRIYQVAESLYTLSPVIRNINNFRTFIMKRIISLMSSSSTTANNEIIYEITLLKQSILLLKRNPIIMNEYKDIFKKMECISEILLRQCCSKFHITLIFENFPSIETGKKFAETCLQLDDIDLLHRIAEIWNFDPQPFIEKQVLSAYELSIFENAISPKDFCILSNEEKVEREYLSESLINHLSFHLFYDTKISESFIDIFPPLDLMIDFYTYLPPIFKKEKSKTTISSFGGMFNTRRGSTIGLSPPLIPSHHNMNNMTKQTNYFQYRLRDLIKFPCKPPKVQRDYLEKFLNTKCSPTTAISFYSDYNIEEALNIINKINNEKTQEELFEKYLFEKCIEYDNIGRLRSVLQSLPNYAKTYLTSLLSVIDKYSLLNLKLEVGQFLGLYDIVAETAINLYNEQYSNIQSLNLLDVAQVNITQELKRRENEKKYHRISTPKLQEFLKKIEQQRHYCMFLLEKKISGSPNLSVFQYSVNIESMTVLLFKEKNFPLGLEFMTQNNISPAYIGEKIIDIIITEKDKELFTYIMRLEESCPEDVFQEIFYSFINRMIFVFMKIDTAMELIHKVLKNKYSKCVLMIQFCMFEDAAEIAVKNNFIDLLALILNQSFFYNKKELYNKYSKHLETIES
ncbi:hypothetical protein TRFO_05623 [Tritrichomonas foetus]|uniref:Uncharacterized protein n=1 Tax=Tritrichomonas foetus TaxID=1144522 RepID=A0A1J4K9N0_9EUKA|nr:hypothetical protein TRFO_05623 [Tritrichomonas foetus]|eukprot:OHT06412.1 hypothetical protein TRFO_05623 [Tritrichomonas foetus]